MDFIDLNRPPSGGDGFLEDRDHGRHSGPVEVVFRNHRNKLLKLFKEARERNLACAGACAWLTDLQILGAMATVPTSIVVQKEDLLRPDIPAKAGLDAWKRRLRRQYEAIEASDRRRACPGVPFDRLHMPWPLCDMHYAEDHSVAGVRCFGLRNKRDGESGGRLPLPLMHHKFIIFLRGVGQPRPFPGCRCIEGQPCTVHWEVEIVWTGSYNFSRLAARSRENAIVIRDQIIGHAYLHEWADMMDCSEPLDWDSKDLAPQWRLGS